MKANSFFPALLGALVLALPTTGLSDHNKVTVYRDRDGDGHYNKKTYDHGGHNHGYYGGYGGYYGRGYYGYGRGYGYRGYPYYGSGYRYGYYPRSTFGISIYSRPTYYTSRVYRGSVVDDSLAADVQRALKRRGYYYGSVDGDIGSGSRAAIRSYQRDHGLSISGRIDSALLRSLRIG